MLHRSLTRIFCPIVLASWLPSAAMAQIQSQGFYATLYGQHSQIAASNFTESGALGAGQGLRAEFGSGFGLGGDLGYRYGNGWASEVEWNYRRHPLNALRKDGSQLSRDGDFASNILLINGLRRFQMSGGWTPYLGAGIGWVQEIDMDIAPSHAGAQRGYSAGSKSALQFIAGAEYMLSPKWRLIADVRWLRISPVRLDNEESNPGGSAGPLKYTPVSVQLGVRYSF